jgi:hypothetical protein
MVTPVESSAMISTRFKVPIVDIVTSSGEGAFST